MSVLQSIDTVSEKASNCFSICLDAVGSINHDNTADLSSEQPGLWKLWVGYVPPHSHSCTLFIFVGRGTLFKPKQHMLF